MSTWRCEVVQVGELTKHPNADTLSVTTVFGYPTVVRTADWASGDLGVYIPPDSVVPKKYLAGGDSDEPVRVRVSKIRKLPSFGFLMKPPPGDWKIGQDAAEAIGVKAYEPPAEQSRTDGQAAPPPKHMACEIKYDLENYRRWTSVFPEGTPCYVTEKIHGANARYIWSDGQLHIGTRTRWLLPGDHIWSRAVTQNPRIEEICRSNPEVLFFGEVFGNVQDMKYGASKSDIFFRFFDGWCSAYRWMPRTMLVPIVGEQWMAPLLYHGPFYPNIVLPIAEAPSIICKEHGKEGIVIECSSIPVPFGGPSKLKHVSNWYLER